MEFIKKFWHLLIIGVLVVALIFSTCGRGPITGNKSDTTTSHYVTVDTSYKDTLITNIKYAIKNVEIRKASQERLDSFSKASKNYDSLLQQYNGVKKDYLAYTKSRDTVELPHKGYVANEYVISKNQLESHKYDVYARDQIVTIHDSTVTKIETILPPTRKVLYGGELTGNVSSPINGINSIVAYQDRAGRQYQLKAGVLNANGKITSQFGAGLLWTIKLHR